MNTSFKELLAKVAPVAATFLGGPLAGAVTQRISSALLGREDGTPAELATALIAPDAALKLREIELDFDRERNRHAEAAIQADNADRSSAREREVKTGDRTQAYLAYGVTAGFFLVLGGLMSGVEDSPMRDVLLVMVGSLGQAWGGVVSYYFGSSKGSDAKTDLLARKA